MFEKLSVTQTAQALARHAGARLGIVAQNIANADTPKYKGKDLPSFSESYEKSSGFVLRTTRGTHISSTGVNTPPEAILSGGMADPNGNDVSLDLQMMKSVEARQSHEMALAIYSSVSSILRTSLGRK